MRNTPVFARATRAVVVALAVVGFVVVAVAVLAAATRAQAQETPRAGGGDPWPQRSVRLVVPVGPASGADITARLLADELSRRWGQPVVVENRPGADGIVGVTYFTSGSDDHALLLAPTGTFTASPLLHPAKGLGADRLAPIARLTTTVIAVAVPASLKIDRLADLVAYVRSQPGRAHWASTTGATDLVFSGFLDSEGLDMVRVPYRDGILALNDLGEGRIEVYMSALAAILPQAQAGRVRMLALSNRARAAVVADLPTVAEAGYPGLQYDGLVGLFASAGTPPARRQRIAADVAAVISDPAFAARIAATGQIVVSGGPAELERAVAEQASAFKAIALSLHLQP